MTDLETFKQMFDVAKIKYTIHDFGEWGCDLIIERGQDKPPLYGIFEFDGKGKLEDYGAWDKSNV